MTTYLFRPPTVEEGPAGDGPLFIRYRLHRGMTVLKNGSTYTTVRWPSQEEIEDADAAYIGGHEYIVTSAEATALTAAGYTVVGFEGDTPPPLPDPPPPAPEPEPSPEPTPSDSSGTYTETYGATY